MHLICRNSNLPIKVLFPSSTLPAVINLTKPFELLFIKNNPLFSFFPSKLHWSDHLVLWTPFH